ncbi:hypothetical protein IDJ75_01780 [Mucilaginibacter rigui]|uniref:DUF4352 domain-containing protein n=1 Tax=Mucilaginibacter rigui TaxID=534635 RepID=A0ABR7X1Z2_9SPHI|nr:hypothetical protein [Mucilaginibacter rigui]MBD1383990.1 hypothetical protein [Mucilaginibacter rigui]
MTSSKKYILLAIAVIIVALAGIGFYNRELIKVYYTDTKERPFKSGDKVYAIKAFSIMNDSTEFLFFRLIKSKTTSERQIIYNGTYITVKTFNKNHSTGLGSFIEREFFWGTGELNGKTTNVIAQLYAVIPDKNLIEHSPTKDTMPAGFEYANDMQYVAAYTTSTKNQFKKF